MMISKMMQLILAVSLISIIGCQASPHVDLTFQRGVQLLAAGSPKTAIPLLTQVVSSIPDGPEPHAMLAMAYALDLQSERAIAQARQAQREKNEPPGWELIAVGIAELSQGRYDKAASRFDEVDMSFPPEHPMSVAARQWLVLSMLLKGDFKVSMDLLNGLEITSGRSTAMLWTVLVLARQGMAQEASEMLAIIAATSSLPGPTSTTTNNPPDSRTLYEQALIAVSVREFDKAQESFTALIERNSNSCDAPTWLALIAAAEGDWSLTMTRLRDGCETGSNKSRGVANQLYGVACAMERMPDNVVRSMVVGQRLLGRGTSPAHAVSQPKPDAVWLSDSMK